MNQKGLAPILIVILGMAVILAFLVGYITIWKIRCPKGVNVNGRCTGLGAIPSQFSPSPLATTHVPTTDATANWKTWKPSIDAFTFKLPTNWSVISVDGGHFSEIRIYSSNVTWEQAHELERIGDLTLRINLTSEVTKTDSKLTWSSDEVRMKSNTLILDSEKGPLTFSAGYSIDNPHRKTIEEIIRTFNFQPTLTELDQANNIP